MIPESPRWLIQKGRISEATAIIARVEGSERANEVVEEIKSVIAAEDVSILQLFKPGMRTALTIGIMLSLFDQITGINIVFSWLVVPETKGKTLEQIEQHWDSFLRRRRT